MSGPEALDDADGSGLDVSRRFFEGAEEVVVSDTANAHLAAGAEEALDRSAPLLMATGHNAEAISDEIDRLGAQTVLTVGEVAGVSFDGVKVVDATPAVDEGAVDEAGDATVDEAEDAAETEAEPEDVPDASVDARTAIRLDTAVGADHSASRTATQNLVRELAEREVSIEPQDKAIRPTFVTDRTSVPAVATAKAAGAPIELLDFGDPRITAESMKTATAGPTFAIGRQFGGQGYFERAVEMADNGELPGGGGLVFPGRRMIALYGHPSGGALGLLGEQSAQESVERVQGYVDEYQPLDEQPVIPAFEIIVTIASEFPGDDGNYSNEFPVEDYTEYVDAITDAGGYAVLDLQSGRASFLEQAKLYEELLKRPNVGLALDPEWNIGPDELPMERVGSAEAEEVNEVAEWLADLVRENDLPQKAFVLHQFQSQMLRDREQISTDYPELAFVLHADGHGTPDLKYGTWNVLQQELTGRWFLAWKNFLDEDSPMFTPEQTYNEVTPRPWFVSYQ